MTSRTGSDELVRRLRLAALAEHTMYGGDAGSLLDDAADEIERLRAITTPDTDRVAVLEALERARVEMSFEGLNTDFLDAPIAALSQPLGSQER